MGSNATKVETWTVAKGDFAKDYRALIESFQALPSKPVVYLALSPTIYKAESGKGFSPGNLVEALVIMRQVASDAGVRLIDVHAATSGHAAAFPDGVHPNEDGQRLIAAAIAAAIIALRHRIRSSPQCI